MLELKTYEDHEAFYKAEGWGCKSCGELSSTDWFEISGDCYCARCTADMKAELGRSIKARKYPRREFLQEPATWEHDPSRFGHQYAEDAREAYAALHSHTTETAEKLFGVDADWVRANVGLN